MELTVSIKEQSKIAAFLELIKTMDYIEIVDVKETSEDIPAEHRDLLEKRLQRVESGESQFKNWDVIKDKYERKSI